MCNQVTLEGMVTEYYKDTYEDHGENFYKMCVSVERDSGVYDVIPVMIPERLVDCDSIYVGKNVFIKGEFRARNERDEVTKKSKLILYVFPSELEVLECDECENEIYLEGYICKQPTHRMTPLGREITDVLIAVQRRHGKSDYIPCIVWGRNAKYVSSLLVGSCIRIDGRIQSRVYYKDNVPKTAYEVSGSTVQLVV